MVALSACPGRRQVVVWASYWRRGRSGNAIGLTKVAHQSAVRAQHGLYCSHTEGRFSDIRWPHGNLMESLCRHDRSVVAIRCDGGLSLVLLILTKGTAEMWDLMWLWWEILNWQSNPMQILSTFWKADLSSCWCLEIISRYVPLRHL